MGEFVENIQQEEENMEKVYGETTEETKFFNEIIKEILQNVEEESEKKNQAYYQLFTSRHLFEVELWKYKSILEQRKFFGIDRIEIMLMVGQRGLLLNRKQNSNKSLTEENNVEKYYNKMKEHNKNVKKIRQKYQTKYFERYPEKLEQMLKEEQEIQKNKTEQALKKQVGVGNFHSMVV